MSIQKRLIAALAIGCSLSLTGCDMEPEKTPSMLYRENADKEVNSLVVKTEQLLTPEVLAAPQQHLDTLIIIEGQINDAVSIYRQRNINNWQNPGLQTLQTQLQGTKAKVAQAAIELMLQLHQRTKALRQEIEKAKTQPYSSKARSPEKLVAFLAQEYLQQITDCCLNKLAQTEQLLRHDSDYKAVWKLTRGFNRKLERMLREEAYVAELGNKINALPGRQ